MSKLYYVTESEFHDLKSNILSNLNNYLNNSVWIENYFNSNTMWKRELDVSFDYQELIVSKDACHDIENAKKVFSSLKSLTLAQATDDRIWTYLTHTIYWDYMIERWSVSNINKNKEEYIKTRYFSSGKEGNPFIRNGISRLWWMAYSTYDETRENPFELTEYLMSSFSFAWNLLTRNFSQNTKLLKFILSSLLELEWVPKGNENVSNLVKYINQVGGITILDALEKEDVKKVLANYLGK